MTNILGISAYYHDSAACLLTDGEIVAAAQEERFTRRKHDPGFPLKAIEYCLAAGGISSSDIDYVAFYDKPLLKFERILKTHAAYAPKGWKTFSKAAPVWLERKLFIKQHIEQQLGKKATILFPEHHESHAMSAFYPSPFKRAAVLTVDGVGEWATTTIAKGEGNQLTMLNEIRFPHSLGLLYSAITSYCGFKVNSGEYKLMGLAPYGKPKYTQLFYDELIDIKQDGSFHLNMKHFSFPIEATMTNTSFHDLFGGPPREAETPISQKEMDIARSVQEVTEEVILRLAKHAKAITGMENICLAGGVALNCVANGRLQRERIFENLWVQPAAGDAGGALGAALGVWYSYLGNGRTDPHGVDAMKGSYLGPAVSNEDAISYLDQIGAVYEYHDDPNLFELTANLLAAEKVVGWVQGRMEFGPRALGSRSIIGDPRSSSMQEVMNKKIKFRESFRPFAPSVLAEYCNEWFDLDSESPYMLLVAPVKQSRRMPMSDEEENLFGIEKLNIARSEIPAVTHVDYSARVQTVHENTNQKYFKLLETFNEKYSCPVLINTSFNVRGEPPVCSAEDAYVCFMRTEMDYLVIGNIVIDKKLQKNLESADDWKKEFELD